MSALSSFSLKKLYKTSSMREGILNWYPFEKTASVLESTNGALTPFLRSSCSDVTTFCGVYSGEKKFDYVIALDVESITPALLKQYRSYLNPRGKLLLAFDNSYGLQYFAGKPNPRTDLPFQFWEGESKANIAIQLKQAGFDGQKWYYPYPNHYFTREVYSQNLLPNEFFNNRGSDQIEFSYAKVFDERKIWKEVIRNGAFAFLCPSYLVEARLAGSEECIVDFAAITAYRERDKAFVTIVNNDMTVVKQALYFEGRERLKNMKANHDKLASLGVNVIPVAFTNDRLLMKRIALPTLWDYWTTKLHENTLDDEMLIRHFDKIRSAIYKSSVNGKLFWELVPANCFYDEQSDSLLFFDQEYCWSGLDPDVGVVRAIYALKYSAEFHEHPLTEGWIEKLKNRYALSDKWDEILKVINIQMLNYVFNKGETAPIKRDIERAFNRTVEHTYEQVKKQELYKRMLRVAQALKKRSITKPAIYGYGARGSMLRFALESLDIDVAFIMDAGNPVVYGRSLVSSIDEISGYYAEMIIVTPAKQTLDIVNRLKEKTNIPVMTIEELVNE